MSKQLSFTEMIDKIKSFDYPRSAAFVTIWWWDLREAAALKTTLSAMGYKVYSYKNRDEVEIRFSYK